MNGSLNRVAGATAEACRPTRASGRVVKIFLFSIKDLYLEMSVLPRQYQEVLSITPLAHESSGKIVTGEYFSFKEQLLVKYSCLLTQSNGNGLLKGVTNDMSSKSFDDYAKQLNEAVNRSEDSVVITSVPSSPLEHRHIPGIKFPTSETRSLKDGTVSEIQFVRENMRSSIFTAVCSY